MCSLELNADIRFRIGHDPPDAEAHLDRMRGQTVCPALSRKTGLNCWEKR
jgi:hypothetical protein